MLCFANQRSGTYPAVSVVCDFEQAVELFALIFFFPLILKIREWTVCFITLKRITG